MLKYTVVSSPVNVISDGTNELFRHNIIVIEYKDRWFCFFLCAFVCLFIYYVDHIQ